jgi:hypothetical protein
MDPLIGAAEDQQPQVSETGPLMQTERTAEKSNKQDFDQRMKNRENKKMMITAFLILLISTCTILVLYLIMGDWNKNYSDSSCYCCVFIQYLAENQNINELALLGNIPVA